MRVCPRCGKEYDDYPAISRLDNETEICPECGTAEALEDFFYGKVSSDWKEKEECMQ